MATCLMFGTLTREASKASKAIRATRIEAIDRLAAVQGNPCPR